MNGDPNYFSSIIRESEFLMGDDLEGSSFLLENDTNLISSETAPNERSSGDHYFVDDDSVAEAEKDQKKEKNKRKIAILKEKVNMKKMRLNEDTSTDAIDSDNNIQPSQQFQIIVQSMPHPDNTILSLLPKHFFDPHPTLSLPNIECPFVQAIAAGLKSYKKKLKKKYDEAGCPLVLIICSDAGRAATVIKSLSKELKCRIAKLFSRHFKVN